MLSSILKLFSSGVFVRVHIPQVHGNVCGICEVVSPSLSRFESAVIAVVHSSAAYDHSIVYGKYYIVQLYMLSCVLLLSNQ